MKICLKLIVAMALVFVFSLPCPAAYGVAPEKEAAQGKKIVVQPTADHRKFKQLKEGFNRGPEVTKACLACHTEAAKQVHDTIHWTWSKKKKGQLNKKGKAYTLNSF
ncbi:MAG: hypothetical protein U9P37_05445 [Pseudomonadota bacterium]|nr:hypothetical protein [Pseudomonadota bacterium]